MCIGGWGSQYKIGAVYLDYCDLTVETKSIWRERVGVMYTDGSGALGSRQNRSGWNNSDRWLLWLAVVKARLPIFFFFYNYAMSWNSSAGRSLMVNFIINSDFRMQRSDHVNETCKSLRATNEWIVKRRTVKRLNNMNRPLLKRFL